MTKWTIDRTIPVIVIVVLIVHLSTFTWKTAQASKQINQNTTRIDKVETRQVTNTELLIRIDERIKAISDKLKVKR